MAKLAIIATHPIQYYSPWFQYINQQKQVTLKVFYLWDSGVATYRDAGFGENIKWDIPLLNGYDYEFLPNVARNPGTHHIMGLRTPELNRRIELYAPDAVLLLGYNYLSFYRAILGPGRLRCPILFRGDSHRIGRTSSAKEALRRYFISFIFSRFSAVLSVGSANYKYFHYHGIPEEKIFSSPHCVDNERFFSSREQARSDAEEWKVSLGIPSGASVIMYIGKFQRIKRVHDLIKAFVSADLKNSALLIVGEGEERNMLERLVENDPRIYFAPFQNQSLMPRTLMASDLVVLPSESESWGLILNEAMCMGKGVVASDRVGGARDLIHPGRNGYRYRCGDIEALAAILRKAVANKKRLERWGEASTEIIQNFSYEQATEGLYRALAYVGLGGNG